MAGKAERVERLCRTKREDEDRWEGDNVGARGEKDGQVVMETRCVKSDRRLQEEKGMTRG
ncbi:hypothetical protein BWQ96_03959 [Gracilariopsis chorda]|uniref:Uncharacterized protein n=1 Tax=Gracilariopsis chorda TaxID=448386 RepID=A0A2V3IW58_9FLOR|nr:hypothetical protein BWQ96_03959 [Gracilariopsis chorda]|eukprot:PXF46303.1 hypothetical protein BWQ96_03959 [Gracilariopsis chorda]